MFRLCLALGISHPSRIDLETPEVVDWWRYYQQEPWGDYRADMRAEVQRILSATDESELDPIWPYVPEHIQRQSEMTDAEFIADMKRRGREILEQKGLLKNGDSRDAQYEPAGVDQRIHSGAQDSL